MTNQPRFIVLAQGNGYVIHDRADGDDSPPITRYSNAAHLCAQFNRQSERDAQYEAAKDEHCATFGQPSANRAQAVELQRDPRGGFLS